MRVEPGFSTAGQCIYASGKFFKASSMIATKYFDSSPQRLDGAVGHIVLRPNNSMTWRAAQYFLGVLMAISFTVATAFLWHGYWMILPFTAVEMSFLSACFYYIIKRSQHQEVIRFSVDEITVECGRKTPDICLQWPRFYTKIMVSTPRHPWYPIRISLRCRQQDQEIGQFLTSEEKDKLVKDLRHMISAADIQRVQYSHQ
jgi:uncharacterized membrane protein